MLAVFVRYFPKYPFWFTSRALTASLATLYPAIRRPERDRRIAETGAIDFALARPNLLPARLRRAGGAYRIDFLVGRKPPEGFFRKHQPAVDGNLERPANSRHQLDFGAVSLNQPCPRTEGPRFIVSRLAPLDPDFHLRPPLPLSLSEVLPRPSLA